MEVVISGYYAITYLQSEEINNVLAEGSIFTKEYIFYMVGKY